LITRFSISPHLLRQIPPRIANYQVIEKRYERRQCKAKCDEKAEFMSINENFEEHFNAAVASAIVLQQPDIAERYFPCVCNKLENLAIEEKKLNIKYSTSNYEYGCSHRGITQSKLSIQHRTCADKFPKAQSTQNDNGINHIS
jgi:hypothetical protein